MHVGLICESSVMEPVLTLFYLSSTSYINFLKKKKREMIQTPAHTLYMEFVTQMNFT